MQYLIYYVSENQSQDSCEINTPLGARYLRVVLYRGGADPLEWADRNARPGETVLNTIQES